MSLCLQFRHQYDDSALKCLTSVELTGKLVTSHGVTSLVLDAHALIDLKVKGIDMLEQPSKLSNDQNS